MVFFIFGQENVDAAVMDTGVGEITVAVIPKRFITCIYGGCCTADDVCQLPDADVLDKTMSIRLEEVI